LPSEAWIVVQAVVAGAAFQLAAVQASRHPDEIRVATGWLAGLAAIVGGTLVANTGLPVATGSLLEVALFVRMAGVVATIVLMVVVVGQLTGRRVPPLLLWPLVALGVVRLGLWLGTDLVWAHRLDAQGWPVLAAGHLWTALPTFPLVIGWLWATRDDWQDPFERAALLVALTGTIAVGVVATVGAPEPRELATGMLGVPLLVGVAVVERHRCRVLATRHERNDRQRAALADSLRTANAELNAALAVRDQVLDAFTHELRTPLTPIKGYVELLRDRHAAMDPATLESSLAVVDRNVDRLHRMIDEVLTARAVRPGVTPRPSAVVAIDEVVREAARDVGAPDVMVTCPPDLRVEVPRHHLLQVLWRLVENAVRHGRPPIEVRVAVVDDGVEVRVVDHGDGVPPAFRSRLFEPFAQASAGPGRASGGLGLGLSTARRFAESMGATLVVDTGPVADRAGTCFTLRLPAGSVVEPEAGGR
jgi:signal transduction histidine kinase